MKSAATIRIYNRLQELTTNINISPLVKELAELMVDNNINTSIIYLSSFSGTDIEKEQIIYEFISAYKDRKKQSTKYVLCMDIESTDKDEFEKMISIADMYLCRDVSFLCPYEANSLTNIKGFIYLNETGKELFIHAKNKQKYSMKFMQKVRS